MMYATIFIIKLDTFVDTPDLARASKPNMFFIKCPEYFIPGEIVVNIYSFYKSNLPRYKVIVESAFSFFSKFYKLQTFFKVNYDQRMQNVLNIRY